MVFSTAHGQIINAHYAPSSGNHSHQLFKSVKVMEDKKKQGTAWSVESWIRFWNKKKDINGKTGEI